MLSNPIKLLHVSLIVHLSTIHNVIKVIKEMDENKI